MAAPAWAQIAPAGSVIGNQATATYETPAGETVQVLSNLVETVVNQVVAVDIEPAFSDDQAGGPDDTLLGPRPFPIAGGQVTFPHVIENVGNGPDVFDLVAPPIGEFTAPAGATVGQLLILPDADGDGVADNNTPITQTPELNPGETFGIVVVAEISAGDAALIGDGNNPANPVIVTATSTATGVSNPGEFDAVADTVEVTAGAVILSNKTITPAQGGPGTVFRIRLEYENVGDSEDIINVSDPLPPQLVYVGNPTWSDDGGAALTDADDGVNGTSGTLDTIEYQLITGAHDGPDGINGTADDGTETVLFEISGLPGQTSGFVEFDVQVAPDAAPGTYNNGIFTCVGDDCDPDEPGPQPPFTVDPALGVTLADSAPQGTAPFADDAFPDQAGEEDLGGAPDQPHLGGPI